MKVKCFGSHKSCSQFFFFLKKKKRKRKSVINLHQALAVVNLTKAPLQICYGNIKMSWPNQKMRSCQEFVEVSM
jgi:hypothetical protein